MTQAVGVASGDLDREVFGERYWKERRDYFESIKAKMSPPGALGLPALLEDRRIRFSIPDGLFRETCLYDRVLLFQVKEHIPNRTAGDTSIIMPENVQQKEEDRTPVGIVISAGPKALDELRSNGADLGHVVRFVQISIIRVQCDTISGKPFWGIPVRSCDIYSSFDLTDQLRSGERRLVYDSTLEQHVYEGAAAPVNPLPNEL